MNKTSKQVEKFLSQCKFKSQIDFEMIQSFCVRIHGFKINAPKLFNETTGIDVSLFTKWYSEGFAQGEVVRWNNNLAILYSASITQCSILYYIDENGTLHCKDQIQVNTDQIQHATPEESKQVFHNLIQKGLELNYTFLLITEKYIPCSGKLIKFWNDETTGFGAVRNISKSGSVEMYCYFTLDGEVRYSMHETIGNIEDFQFDDITTSYRRKLDLELNKYNKVWNDYRKRVEPANLRLPVGSSYFYVSDTFKPIMAEDNGKATANLRYLCGNYFHNVEEAQQFINNCDETRKNDLAK